MEYELVTLNTTTRQVSFFTFFDCLKTISESEDGRGRSSLREDAGS